MTATRLIRSIRSHLVNSESQHRKIAQGFLWVSLFVLLGKLAGAAKEMTIAWRYGISETVDAYVFVFNLVNWPVSIWFSVLTVVLVPLVARLRSNNPDELPRFRAELLGLTLLIGLGLGLLAWFGLPALLRAGWLGLSGKALAEALHMTHGLALLALFGAPISLFSALLLAAGRHRNTLFEAIPALILLIFLLLPPGLMPEPLLWGTLAGFALHMTALATPLYQRGELPAPTFSQRSPAWQTFWGSIGIMAAGQVLMSLTNLMDQFFAAGLGAGALSTLSYANRVLALILGLGATAISRATLPVFSGMQSSSLNDVKKMALQWAGLMFFLGCLVLVVAWVLAPWIVALLFERGAFTIKDTDIVASVFRIALLQIPLYFFCLVMVSYFASQKKFRILFYSGLIGLVIKFILSFLLVPEIGLYGLILATGFVYMANGLMFLLVIKNE